MVMMMVPPSAAADGLRKILKVGKLPGARSLREIRRQLVQLIRRRRVALGIRLFRRALQVIRNLLGDLPVLGRTGLLNLLEAADDLRQRRKLAAICGTRRTSRNRTGRG